MLPGQRTHGCHISTGTTARHRLPAVWRQAGRRAPVRWSARRSPGASMRTCAVRYLGTVVTCSSPRLLHGPGLPAQPRRRCPVSDRSRPTPQPFCTGPTRTVRHRWNRSCGTRTTERSHEARRDRRRTADPRLPRARPCRGLRSSACASTAATTRAVVWRALRCCIACTTCYPAPRPSA